MVRTGEKMQRTSFIDIDNYHQRIPLRKLYSETSTYFDLELIFKIKYLKQ